MPGPKGIITVKGSFEVSDLCDKEFHKMAQNFGMITNYAEKVKSTTTEGVKLLEERAVEPETKKPRVEASREDKVTEEGEKATTV
jgi:Asp-tRNA(Asn)/Glu-tRNA(Gln) amidotransferase C subunit